MARIPTEDRKEYLRQWRQSTPFPYHAATKETSERRREWYRKWRKQYSKKNRKRINETAVVCYRRRRERALTMYGGKCACCGISDYEFLTFDHIDGGGRYHRKYVMGGKGVSDNLVRWLLLKMRPGFRVLCYNCNCAIGHYGFCPHAKTNTSATS
jgi:hypothetical protein